MRAPRWAILIGLTVLCIAAVATWAAAKPADLALLKQFYAPKEGTDLAKANCLACHAKMPPTKTDLNPYGKDLQKTAAGKPVDEKAFRAIEKLDSDKDGFSNLDELKAGALPGDPKSKPRR
jgi:mono/diheme cytochrome c family protein